MALFRDAQGRKDGGSGYARAFGDPGLGQLLSRVQATVISSGSELEKMISEQVSPVMELDKFLEYEIMPDGVFLVTKKVIKASKTIESHGSEPDFLIFKRRENRQHCHIIELKDGDTFDTKKAQAEHRSLHSFVHRNAPNIQFKISVHFVAFNQGDKTAIVIGFKNKVPERECMTGREFCDLLEISYEEILNKRKRVAERNLNDFINELLNLDVMQNHLQHLLTEGKQ